MYILRTNNIKNCYLGIGVLEDKFSDFIILGDIFFHHQIVIFDKGNNRIGFINNYKTPYIFFSNNLIEALIVFISFLISVSGIFILFLRKKTQKAHTMLTEPLRKPNM